MERREKRGRKEGRDGGREGSKGDREGEGRDQSLWTTVAEERDRKWARPTFYKGT